MAILAIVGLIFAVCFLGAAYFLFLGANKMGRISLHARRLENQTNRVPRELREGLQELPFGIGFVLRFVFGAHGSVVSMQVFLYVGSFVLLLIALAIGIPAMMKLIS